MTRSQFETIISPRLREIEECVQECLKRAQISAKQIGVVIKVGGSSKNKFIDKLLGKYFTKIEEADLQNSVVAGLAIAANELFY